MELKKRIGQRIAETRHARGLTIKALSEQTVDLKLSRINNWELGIRSPGPEEAKQLAKILDVSPAYLLCLIDEPGHYQHKPTSLITTIPILNAAQFINAKGLFEKISKQDIANSPYFPVHDALACKMSAHAFAMEISDDSMSPKFEPGNIVVFDPEIKPKPGQLVLAFYKKESNLLFRKYQDKGNEGARLLPLNEHWATVEISKQYPAKIVAAALMQQRIL